jgi:dihydrodipicolinate synthase/N-acetylneuraminate lyase
MLHGNRTDHENDMKTLDDKTLTRLKMGGVWIPSPLALDRNKRPSEKWQRLLTLYYIRAGARTIVPGAHTGEFSGGSLEIYRYWLGLIREMVAQYGGGEMFLMAAVSGKDHMRQAELAAREGYDIVMLAPTAFTKKTDREVVRIFRDVAKVIPVFGFELQKLVPGSRDFTYSLWQKIFEISYGAKSASFNTYRAQTMLEAAAMCPRRDELVLVTGNDDRIVADLGGVFPFTVGGTSVRMTYAGGLLGHFATDTHAAVQWAGAVLGARAGKPWPLRVPEKELAHIVNMCNGALFDAKNDFRNSVWGVKYRLTSLGLLPGPWCFHEKGRKGLAEEIDRAYEADPVISDREFLAEFLTTLKREVGIQP